MEEAHQRRWLIPTLKRFMIPPMIPLLLLIALCICTFIDESKGPPRIINGHADNAPRRAALIIIMVSPLTYIIFCVLNLIDTLTDHLPGKLPMFSSLLMSSGIITLLIMLMKSYPFQWQSTLGLVLTGIFSILPMSLLRRHFYPSWTEVISNAAPFSPALRREPPPRLNNTRIPK